MADILIRGMEMPKYTFICDQCGYKWFFNAEEAHFCPNCGADMSEARKGERDGK